MTKTSTEKVFNSLHKLTTGVLIPVVLFLLGQINEVHKELTMFEVKVAQDSARYAVRDDIVRMETKIDELKTLIIQEIKRDNL